MNEDQAKKTVAVCDTQPITAQGLRNLLASSQDLELVEAMNSLESAAAYVHAKTPDIVVVDKGFGMRAVLDWIHDLKLTDATPAITVWGVSMTEAEALRLLQAGPGALCARPPIWGVCWRAFGRWPAAEAGWRTAYFVTRSGRTAIHDRS